MPRHDDALTARVLHPVAPSLYDVDNAIYDVAAVTGTNIWAVGVGAGSARAEHFTLRTSTELVGQATEAAAGRRDAEQASSSALSTWCLLESWASSGRGMRRPSGAVSERAPRRPTTRSFVRGTICRPHYAQCLIARREGEEGMGSITDDRLIYGGLDANTMQPSDRGDPRRTPLPLLTGDADSRAA
jgi:hypothetical protein